ncbi:hypothetical protein L3Y34_019850 [Caenorhabditis briggsae]|uniref:Uncharacterized protein n=2 Tax=Caenorhabditis briggsae TaxID=6238 RepID=A0AAE9DPT7_CAEBR|nr:hypothetical protein L3Y34_019850 [Caenorhabditis briggsae]
MSEPYNPRDRIKNHLKRKSTSSRNVTLPAAPAPVSFEGLDVNTESCPVPTNNPFRVGSPQKKRRNQVTFCDETEDAQDSFGANYLKVAESQKTKTKSPMKALRTSPRKRKTPHFARVKSFDPTLLQEFHAVDFSQLLPASSSSGSLPVVELESSPDIPVDNRIGGKLRLVSKFPFPWMNTRKSTGIVAVRIPAIERYDAVKYHNRMYISGQEDPSVYSPSSVLALLEASALYYQFPVVPGMTLYPRITSELKNVARVPLPPLCTDTMFTQWVECYEQLFMSYKKGERDHFYVASAVFNVLFTKKPENSEDVDVFGGPDETSQSCFGRGQELVALVSHTTSSTREHLRKQGVDYEVIGAKTSMKRSSSVCLFGPNTNTMDCLLTDSRENSRLGEALPSMLPVDSWILGDDKKDLKRDSDQSEEDENDSPTKANADWLKEVGVSPRQVKGVGNARRQLSTQLSERDGISCLLVKGPAVQSLYNTLMTSDIVHEKTGPYTKIPPTLIASSPFLYGQLLSLNKTSQIISKAGSKCSEYVLEMDKGPILPHCSKMLTKFIRAAQLCRDEKTVQVQVADRHTGQGMSDWTDRSTNWNTVTVHEDCVKWTKKE